MMRLLIITLSVFALIAAGCSSSEVQKDEEMEDKEKIEEVYTPTINLEVKKVYAWVDLMPGGPERFHITGEYIIPESETYDLTLLNLKMINIIQKGRNVFSIKPVVRENEEVKMEGKIDFLFSTLKGLLLRPEFNMDESIKVEFIFKDDDDTYSYMVRDIKVDKVY